MSLTTPDAFAIVIMSDVNGINGNHAQSRGYGMAQITARVPDEVAEALDVAAAALKRSRAEVIRQALESYLEDFDDLTVALERLRDPSDPVLDWDEVRRELLDTD